MQEHRSVLSSLLTSFVVLIALAPTSFTIAEEAKPRRLSLEALRGLPVFHEGRTKPFDSYANLAMESICHRSKGSIKLGFEDYRAAKSKEVPKSAAALFPEGENRSFAPA